MTRATFSIFVLVFLIGSISAARHVKIIGGHNAEIKDFPYLVSIRYGEHYCSGSIISDRHVLTAAHCMDYVNQDEVTIHSGASRTNEEGTVNKILSIHRHPEFDITNGEDGYPAHNIAVLTLKKPIVFNKHQQKIKLPSHDVQNNQVAYMMGWGKMSRWDHSRSRQIQKLRVNLLSSEKCVLLTSHEMTPDQLCSFSTTRQACQGDSGGPLVSHGEVVGVISYADTGDCSGDEPDIFTNVFAYKDFIESVINE